MKNGTEQDIQGLKEEDIKVEARIIAVCDSYDAMVTLRTYKETLSHEEAINEIIRGSGSQFDPKIVESFTDMMMNGERIILS